MAGKKAPAIWLNESIGNFQTNNNSLIIDQLLTEFNERLKKTELSWQQFHTDPNYYDFPYINNYDYAEQAPIVNSTPKTTQTNFVEYFSQLPSTNKFLLDMAVAYLKKTYTPHSNEDILIWVSLSSLDKIGHLYGPYAKEVIDMIYHLDYQIEQFMKEVAQIVPRQETLYVLTADHGIMPIPELAKKEHPDAKRINTKIISAAINNEIKKNFGISDILIDDKIPHIYLNKKITKNLSSPEKERLLKAIQEQLEQIPGIKRAYTNKELEEMRPQIGSYAWHLKNNIYPGRSGNLLLEIEPYVLMSKYKGGTKHNTPHPYNTHVPLILYQPTVYEHKTITQRVWMPQIAATLAKILEINSPSSQALPPLPIS